MTILNNHYEPIYSVILKNPLTSDVMPIYATANFMFINKTE